MRAHVLNGLLATAAVTGMVAWVAPATARFHLAAAMALLVGTVWHMRGLGGEPRARVGTIAAVALGLVAATGFLPGPWGVIGHVAVALMMGAAAVVLHVRNPGRPVDYVEGAAWALALWLLMHLVAA